MKRRTLLLHAVSGRRALCALPLAIACGGTVDKSDAAIDATNDAVADVGLDVGPDADAAPDVMKDVATDAPSDGGACNSLVNGGTAIYTTEKVGVAPTPAGGTVTPGLYFLTTLNDYDGKTGTTGLATQTTMNIAGSDLEFVEQVGVSNTRASIAFSTSNTTFTYNMTCPAVQTYTTGYTATSTSLTFYFDDGKGNVAEEIFVRQ